MGTSGTGAHGYARVLRETGEVRIELTVDEALHLARAAGPLPPVLRSVRADDDAVLVELDPRLLPDLTGMTRLGALLAGVVPVTTRVAGFADGALTLELSASVRGLGVDRLVPLLGGVVADQLARHGLPADAVRVDRADDVPVAVVRVDALLASAPGIPRLPGLRVTGVDLRGGLLRVDLAVS